MPARSACATDGLTRQGKPGCAKISIVELADSAETEIANVVAETGENDPTRSRQDTRFQSNAAAT
jgi:hypothetical protein